MGYTEGVGKESVSPVLSRCVPLEMQSKQVLVESCRTRKKKKTMKENSAAVARFPGEQVVLSAAAKEEQIWGSDPGLRVEYADR